MKRNYLIYILSILFILMIFSASVINSILWIIISIITCVCILFVISHKMKLFYDIAIPVPEIRTNNTVEKAIDEIHRLFVLANEEVIIVSGALNKSIWENPRLIKDLESFEKNILTLE